MVHVNYTDVIYEINQSINQSTNQSISQAVNPIADRLIHQSIAVQKFSVGR